MARLNPNKTKTISFRVSEEDYNTFKEASGNLKLSLSDYIYECITNHRTMDNKHEDMLMKIYFLADGMKHSNLYSILDALERCSMEQDVEVFAKDVSSKIELIHRSLKSLIWDIFNVDVFDGEEFHGIEESRYDKVRSDTKTEQMDIYIQELNATNKA